MPSNFKYDDWTTAGEALLAELLETEQLIGRLVNDVARQRLGLGTKEANWSDFGSAARVNELLRRALGDED